MKQGLTVDEARKQAFLSVKDVSELLNMGTTYVYAHIKSPDCAFNVVTMGKRYVIPSNSFFAWYDALMN